MLIVDDSILISKKLKTMLSSLNYVTIVGHAKNSAEAFAMLSIALPDVIILDIQMPGKNGIEFLTDIRLRHLDTKVIIFTNQPDPYYRNLCKQLGADYFLDKSKEFEKIPHILEYYCTQLFK